MRYLLLTYYRKPDGKIDEQMTVAQRLRRRDIDTANVILDFKTLTVEKASISGTAVPKDFDRIVKYYMQHYESTITRLFEENGYEVKVEKNEEKFTNQPAEHNSH